MTPATGGGYGGGGVLLGNGGGGVEPIGDFPISHAAGDLQLPPDFVAYLIAASTFNHKHMLINYLEICGRLALQEHSYAKETLTRQFLKYWLVIDSFIQFRGEESSADRFIRPIEAAISEGFSIEVGLELLLQCYCLLIYKKYDVQLKRGGDLGMFVGVQACFL